MQDLEEAELTGWKVGYARVSTDDQNLALQIDALVAHGVPREQIYTDTASGMDATRPGFLAAIKSLRRGDTFVIWKLDRLGRDLSQLLRTAEHLREKGVRLVVLTQAIDTTTPMGRFMFSIMGAFAQLEREMIQERTLAGLRAARERGRIGGRRPTFTAEDYEAAARLLRDEAEGGEGLSVAQAAARAGMSKSSLHKFLAERANERADDLG